MRHFIELIDLTMEKGEFIGKRIREISPNGNFSIIAVHENGEIIIPEPDTILKPGIKISLLVKTDNTMDILKRFTQENSETEIFPGIKVELYHPKRT